MRKDEEAGEAPSGSGQEKTPLRDQWKPKVVNAEPHHLERARRKVAGHLGQSDAMETLTLAAHSVGLDLEQLVSLVADSGVMAMPPKDGITETLRLDELGEHLRTQLSLVPRPDRPEWLRELSKVQRGAVVVSMRMDGATSTAIAVEFGVPATDILAVFNDFADKIGQNVSNVRLTTIVGHMQLVAERAQAGAMEKDDWSTFWRIQKDLIGQLQALGIVDKAVHRIEVMHNLDARTKENIERLAQLRVKQLARGDELQVVESETTDDVPEEFVEDDDDE